MTTADGLRQLQLDLCAKHGVAPLEVDDSDKVGIAKNVRTGALPLNGLRLEPQNGTCGWYFWSGTEMSHAPDFFDPTHVGHLQRVCPQVLPFLLLPPGWRFLIAEAEVDVWFDDQLLSSGTS